MDISLYRASVPVFIRGLTNLSKLLEKAQAYASEQGLAEADILEARLAPDMLTLAGQVQRASDAAKAGAARLAAAAVPSFADEEKTFADLQERIGKTIGFLEGIAPASIDATGPAEVTMTVRGTALTFTPSDYLLTFALPNFFFHVTTAHGILRHKNVPIGKSDYLGPLSS